MYMHCNSARRPSCPVTCRRFANQVPPCYKPLAPQYPLVPNQPLIRSPYPLFALLRSLQVSSGGMIANIHLPSTGPTTPHPPLLSWNAIGTTSRHLVPCGRQRVMGVEPISARQELNENIRLSTTTHTLPFWVKTGGLHVPYREQMAPFYKTSPHVGLPRRTASPLREPSHACPGARRQSTRGAECAFASHPTDMLHI